MPKVAKSRVLSARLPKAGDGGIALSLFDALKADGYSASAIITSALLAFGGRVPSDEDRTAQRIIDTVTDNVHAMLEQQKVAMLADFGEELMKHLRSGHFVTGAIATSSTATVNDDEKAQMKNFASGYLERMKNRK